MGSDAALTAFLALEPVTFEYKASANESHVGFIAEDVPDLLAPASEVERGGYKQVEGI